MNFIQHLWESFLQVAENIFTLLEEGISYPEFQRKLKENLNELGQKICREVLELHDEYLRENRDERRGWVVERRGEEKTITTTFGDVTYKRTYYYNKETKEYAHLVDIVAGYGSHARVDAFLKAELIEMATELSYRKSGRKPEENAVGTGVSGQTVMNTIRKYFAQEGVGEEVEHPGRKKAVEVLYVEADEDHVAFQGGKTMQVPLVYVHEGWELKGKSYRLKSVHYISGLYNDPEELWLKVWDYIERNYEVDKIKRIYIAGDGARWIKKGLEVLPNTRYVLDRFHLEKYITRAFGRDTEQRKQIWKALQDLNWAEVEAIMKAAIKTAATDKHKKAIRECRRYIKNNWEGIENYQKYAEEVRGCSAEGHVSHVLSARLSRRPGGWSRQGADQMARLRAMKNNGVDIKTKYLSHCVSRIETTLKICRELIKQQRKAGKELREQLGNIPALRWKKSELAKVLKTLSRSPAQILTMCC